MNSKPDKDQQSSGRLISALVPRRGFLGAGVAAAALIVGRQVYRQTRTVGTTQPPDAYSILEESRTRDRLRIAVIGDIGKSCSELEKLCSVVADRHAEHPYNMVLSVGDVFYRIPGSSVNSHLHACFSTLIQDNIPIFNTMGNEDAYPPNRFAVLQEPLLNMFGRRYYRLTTLDGLLDVFLLDSNVLKSSPCRHLQMDWLESELSRSTAKWKIASLHHPMYSTEVHHGSGRTLIQMLEPVFTRHQVDLVLTGHNHMYERQPVRNGIRYFITGGGSWPNREDVPEDNVTGSLNNRDATYAEFIITRNEIRFNAFTHHGDCFDAGSWSKAAA